MARTHRETCNLENCLLGKEQVRAGGVTENLWLWQVRCLHWDLTVRFESPEQRMKDSLTKVQD
ncbi:unnamed protein product [Sphenostylis stenocarpa]|uniref:Uncharacterized protein n=1 Tax=Sphenostylis stenocarpa TaxID=92480 RepID=A0AA86SSQ5_9FABA|nr:unnamed protein product [Sphenostylis stenocarpa]